MAEQGNFEGDLTIDRERHLQGNVSGAIRVLPGVRFGAQGNFHGSLAIEDDAHVVLQGNCAVDVLSNDGSLVVSGVVVMSRESLANGEVFVTGRSLIVDEEAGGAYLLSLDGSLEPVPSGDLSGISPSRDLYKYDAEQGRFRYTR